MKKQIEIELTKEWLEICEDYCKEKGITLDELATKAIKWWIAKHE